MSQSIQLPVMVLKPAMAGLSKIINKRSTLPVLGCVKITRFATGHLSFEGTDLDACAIYTTEAEKGGKDFTVLVPFDALSNIVKGCSKGVFLQLTVENDQATIRYPAGGSWLQKPIATFKEDEWPVIPQIKTPSSAMTAEFPKTLLTALDCGSDYKVDLMGGWLDVSDPKAHYVVASDGRHMFSANSFRFDLKESLLIPRHKFLQWQGFVEDGQCSLSAGEFNKEGFGWTQIQSAYWTLLIKRSSHARCPSWKQVIPNDAKTHVTFSDEAVAALLDVLPKLPGASHGNAGVTFDLGPMGTIVRGTENGHSSQVNIQGVKIQGNPNGFAADRNLIVKALKLGLHNLAVVDGIDPIVFSDATRKLVIAPLKGDPTPAPSTSSAPAPVEPVAEAASNQPTSTIQQEGEPVKTTNRINPTEPQPETTSTANRMETQPETASALKQAIEKVDQIKESLRSVLGDMNDVLKALNQAQRDKRASQKEVEEVRDALQSLQRIRI